MERGFIAARWEDWELSNEKLQDDEFHDSGNGSSPEESLVSKSSELHLQPISRSHIRLYHHVPEFDRFHSVRCSLCGKVIKVQSFILHCAKRHGYPMGTGPADVIPQRTVMKATHDSPIDNFLLSPPPPLEDVLKDAEFQAVVDNDSNSFMVSSLDREASNCSSATEEQIPVNGEVPLPEEEFERCFLSPSNKLDEDNLAGDFLMTTGPEDINKNNYFNKSTDVPSAVDILEAPPVLDNGETLIKVEPVESKTILSSQTESQIESMNPQFVVNQDPKLEDGDLPLQPPNLYNPTVENVEKEIPTLDPQFLDSEEGLPDDLKNINIKQEFGCPEMTKLLEPDVNLDAICKSEILEDMLILPQVPIDETSKINTTPEVQNVVVPSTSTTTASYEKATPKTRKTRTRSQVFDPDRHCGVPFLKNGQMVTCMRAVTCKAHSLSSRREVPGRSKPLSVLMQILKAEKLAKKEEKERELLPAVIREDNSSNLIAQSNPQNDVKIESLDPSSFLETAELFPQSNILLSNVLNYENSGLSNQSFHEEPKADVVEEKPNVTDDADLTECFSKPFSCLFGASKITGAFPGSPQVLSFDRGAVKMRRLFSNLLGLSPPSTKMSKQSENLACVLAKCTSKTKKGKTNGAAQEFSQKSQNLKAGGDARINSKPNQKSRIGTSNVAGMYGANVEFHGSVSPVSSCSENLLSGVVKQNDMKASPQNFALEVATPARGNFDGNIETDRSVESATAEFSPSCNFSVGNVGSSPTGAGASPGSAIGRISSGMNHIKTNVPQDLLLRSNVPVNQYPSPTNQISPFASSPMATITSPKLMNSPTPNSEIFMKKCELMGYGNANSHNSNTRKRKVSNNQQQAGMVSSCSMVSPIPAKMAAIPSQQSSPTIPQAHQIVFHPTMRQQHVAPIPPPLSPSIGHSPRQKLPQEQQQNWSAQMMCPSPSGYPPTPSPKLPPSPVKQNHHTMQNYQGGMQPQIPNGYMMSSATGTAKIQNYLSPENSMESQCSPVRHFQVANQASSANDVSEFGNEIHSANNRANAVYCSTATPSINLGTEMNTPINTTQRFFPSPQYKTIPKGHMMPNQHYLKQSPINQVPDASLRPQMMPQTQDNTSVSCYPMISPDATGANVVYSGGNMNHPPVNNRQSVIQPTPIRTYRPHQPRYIIPGSNIVSPNGPSSQPMVAAGGLLVPRVAGANNKYIIPNHSAYHSMQSPMGKRYFMRAPAGVMQAASRVHPQSALHVNTRVIPPNGGGYFNNWRATNTYHQPGVVVGVGHQQQMQQNHHQQQVTTPAQHQMMPHSSSAVSMINKQATPPHALQPAHQQAPGALPRSPHPTFQTSPGAVNVSNNPMSTPQQQVPHYPNEGVAPVALPHHQSNPNQTSVIVSVSNGPVPTHIQQVQPANFQTQYYSSLNYLQPEQHNMATNISRNVANVSCSYGDPNLVVPGGSAEAAPVIIE